jgi:hypothetical protein
LEKKSDNGDEHVGGEDKKTAWVCKGQAARARDQTRDVPIHLHVNLTPVRDCLAES